jgi:7,8-dihydropterin-6-yl-methyl-4-(beta-D-ribofuranosyl)aminobenzene 5'-phosphate synthase
MKIRLIADGSTKWQRMIKRWGISFLIGDDVIFDTFGDARVFLHNVKKYKIDLSNVRHVVISHDDWDHIAGLWVVLEKYKDLKVYVVPRFNAELKDRIRSLGVTLVEVSEPMMIRDGVYTTGELAGDSGRGVLYEQALMIKQGKRLGVVTGCAHPKLPDILRAAKDYFHQGIDILIGGFHLKDMEPDRIKEVVEGLLKFGVSHVVPLHCTGSVAVKEFKRFYVQNYSRLREGDSIEV